MKKLLIIIFPFLILYSCNKNEAVIKSNMAHMPVITDGAYYDNRNLYPDRSYGHPTGTILDGILSNAVAEGLPGAVMLVDIPESGTWVSAKGCIDLKNKIPMKKNGMSRIGSITKPFTAVIILQLMQEGSLSLDDPITKFLPADILHGIENADKATIRQLLNHSSGIVNYTDYLDILAMYRSGSNKDQSSLKALDMVRGRHAYFKPGAGCYYSNTGYILLGLIIEKVTGKSLKNNYQERIFTPLGMKSTYFDPENPVHKETARGYIEYGGNMIDVTDFDQACRTPDGGIVSTVYDMAVFIKALVREKKLLSETAFAEMTNHMILDGKNGFFTGLGIIQNTFENGEVMYGHSGGHSGYTGELWYFPSKKLTFAYLINGSRFSGKSSRIISGLLLKSTALLAFGEPGKAMLKKQDASKVASIRANLNSYDEQTKLREELNDYLKKNGVNSIPPAYTIYHGNSGSKFDVEVVQTVDIAGKDSDRIKFYESKNCETAAIIQKGPYTKTPGSYKILNEWLSENGYRQNGPNREYYYRGEWNEINREEWLTEIRMPVTKIKITNNID